MILFFSLAGCQPLPEMELFGVNPATGWNQEQTQIEVQVSNLFPLVYVPSGDAAGHQTDFGVELYLADDSGASIGALSPMGLQGEQFITAMVPPGLEPGNYTIVVEDVRGRAASMLNAFEVRNSDVERFILTPRPEEVDAGETIRLSVDPIRSGTIQDEVVQHHVEVRLEIMPRFSETGTVNPDLTFKVVGPNATWSLENEDPSRPVLTGRIRVGDFIEIRANRDIVADVFIEEVQEASGFPAATGQAMLSWAQGENYILDLILVHSNAPDVEVLPGDGPIFAAAGETLELRHFVRYADSEAQAPSNPDINFFVEDVFDSGNWFVYNPSMWVEPMQLELLQATVPPATFEHVAHQYLTREMRGNLGDNLSTYSSLSAEVFVEPGPVSSLEGVCKDSSVQAGNVVDILMLPFDAYGNETWWSVPPGEWVFEQQVGGETTSLLDISCDENTGGGEGIQFFTCSGRPIVSATMGIDFFRTGIGIGFVGVTTELVVTAGALAEIDLEISPLAGGSATKLVAGEEFRLVASFYDDWGNALEKERVNDEDAGTVDDIIATFELSDPLNDLACLLDDSSVFLDHQIGYICALEQAAVTSLSAQVGAVSGVYHLEVTNGSLSYVDVVLTSDVTDVVAGDTVNVDLTGYDVYGNLFLVGNDRTVVVSAMPWANPAVSTELDELEARSQVSLVVEVAGTTYINAVYDSAIEVGRSLSFEVMANEPHSISIEVARPWIWIDEAQQVSVYATDAFGNIADSLNEPMSLRSNSGAFDEITSTFVAGVAQFDDLVWSEVELSEVLEAEWGTITASTPTLVVADNACATGSPTLSTTLNALPDVDDVVRACLSSGSFDATVAFSSTPASGSINHFRTYSGRVGSTVVSVSSPSTVMTLDGTGRFVIESFVVQNNGCGAATQDVIWTGPAGSSPAGPIPVEPLKSSIKPTLTTAAGMSVVDIGPVFSCNGDFADTGTVFLRADRGTLAGTELLSSGGAGQYVVLDAFGESNIEINAVDFKSGGTASIHAWVNSGAAAGGAVLEVDDDALPPQVWDQSPAGTNTDEVNVLSVRFSEPMERTTLAKPSHFEVCNSSLGMVSISSVDVSDDDRRVTLYLANFIELGDDVWRFAVPARPGSSGLFTTPCGQTLNPAVFGGVTDTRGLVLDGNWSGSTGSHYVLDFGDVSDDSEDVSCGAMSAWEFSPDGDEGAGTGQADSVSVKAITDSGLAPVWWVASVRDAGGTEIRKVREAVFSPSHDWIWDGRDQGERVVEPGEYQVELLTEDGSGNQGASCVQTVVLNNQMGFFDGE